MNVTDNQKGCILHGPKVDLEGVSMSADSETVELITERMYPVPLMQSAILAAMRVLYEGVEDER